MSYIGHIIKIIDNSGLLELKSIKYRKGSFRKTAKLGDRFQGIVRKRKKLSRLRKNIKGKIFEALILTTKRQYLKKDGTCIRWDKTTAIVINKLGEPLATRIKLYATRELRNNQKPKCTLLAITLF